MRYKKIDAADLENLRDIAGRDNVLVNDQIGEDYTHDEMPEYGHASPEVLILGRSTQQISDILRYANEYNLPVTTRGSGTGLVGACVPIHGGILLSLHKMDKIIDLDLHTMTAVVEPGVLLMKLAAKADEIGCLYAPDPGEKSATVGGNVSTNAGGMRAVKYGVTRDAVKGMEVVLASGEVVQFGGKVAKNSSGYALKDLMIGSEGTLGIITKLYLKLLPKPSNYVSLLMPFEDIHACLACVEKVLRLPEVCTTLEFMEREVLDDAQEYLGKEFPEHSAPSYLIVSYSANSKEALNVAVDACAQVCLQNGAKDVLISDTAERQNTLWSARGAFLEAIKNSTPTMDECDVVVPLAHIAGYLDFVRELSTKHQVRIRSFGHAGDGNLHVYVCKDDLDDETWNVTVTSCMDALYQKAIEMEGQVSGEHGIGHAKKTYLKQSLGDLQIDLMRNIKFSFDPNGILNPDKIFDL